WVDNFRYKFEFEAGGGNNMYIDNINIYQGSPSSAGLYESAELVTELVLYPNPTNDELNVSFFMNSIENVIVEIQELTGKVAQSHLINANDGSNLVMVDTSKLASGIYFMKLNVGGRTVSKRFVKR
ncbi:MAG: T9SS type A sorting domain-containing protein, partial [Flavobacteriales bacterium]|nr:T9SS type A sorting domain-containing protein [Flavobacteriales bacterium]